jgi:hypothetical protein
MTCPICLSGFDRDTIHTPCCKNRFCSKCLLTWAETRQDCPLCRSSLRSITQRVTITVIRKCLRKYLKGVSVSFVCREPERLESYLNHHVFDFHVLSIKNRMSRNFVQFEYADKQYEVSFKYLQEPVRRLLFGKTKHDQAMALRNLCVQQQDVLVTKV